MKNVFALLGVTLFSVMAVSAQDSLPKKNKHHPTYDSIPSTTDSTKNKPWRKDKMPKKGGKNWPDSMGKPMPDSLRRPE